MKNRSGHSPLLSAESHKKLRAAPLKKTLRSGHAQFPGNIPVRACVRDDKTVCMEKMILKTERQNL
jgi:hypothetical protein